MKLRRLLKFNFKSSLTKLILIFGSRFFQIVRILFKLLIFYGWTALSFEWFWWTIFIYFKSDLNLGFQIWLNTKTFVSNFFSMNRKFSLGLGAFRSISSSLNDRLCRSSSFNGCILSCKLSKHLLKLFSGQFLWWEVFLRLVFGFSFYHFWIKMFWFC